MKEVKSRFAYIFKKTQEGGGKPKIVLKKIRPYFEFKVGKITILPMPVKHGSMEVISYRIGNFVYMTDVSYIPPTTFNYLKNVDVLVLDALRKEKHPTHFNLHEAIEVAKKTGAKKVYFTHISHKLEHGATEKALPTNMRLAYDGLCKKICD